MIEQHRPETKRRTIMVLPPKTPRNAMGRSRFWLLCMFLLAMPIDHASAQPHSCTLPQKPMMEVELMFGRNIGGRFGVTDARWTEFLAREVTPRFPDGLTVFDTSGQWCDAKKKTV